MIDEDDYIDYLDWVSDGFDEEKREREQNEKHLNRGNCKCGNCFYCLGLNARDHYGVD